MFFTSKLKKNKFQSIFEINNIFSYSKYIFKQFFYIYLATNVHIWKNNVREHYFTQSSNDKTDWTETVDGNVIFRFKTYAENDIDTITLFDASRGMYVKLTATNAQFKYSLSDDFKIFDYGKWLITDSKNTGKKFFWPCHGLKIYQ